MFDKMKKHNRYIDVRPREVRADLTDCVSVEMILIAHERQKFLSELELEHIFYPLSVIANQNDLKIQCSHYESLTQQKFVLKYDVLSMIKALDILERSVMEN